MNGLYNTAQTVLFSAAVTCMIIAFFTQVIGENNPFQKWPFISLVIFAFIILISGREHQKTHKHRDERSAKNI